MFLIFHLFLRAILRYAVVLNGYDTIKEALLKKSVQFAGRVPFLAFKILNPKRKGQWSEWCCTIRNVNICRCYNVESSWCPSGLADKSIDRLFVLVEYSHLENWLAIIIVLPPFAIAVLSGDIWLPQFWRLFRQSNDKDKLKPVKHTN